MRLCVNNKGELTCTDLPLICPGIDSASRVKNLYNLVGIPIRVYPRMGTKSVLLDLDEEKIKQNRKQQKKAPNLPSGRG